MKQITIIMLAIACLSSGLAQGIESRQIELDLNLLTKPTHAMRQITCGVDTISYATQKSAFADNVSRSLGFGPIAPKFGQRYEVPIGTSVTVSGFTFYAWSSDINGADIPVNGHLYNANIQGFPVGQPLATASISVDASYQQNDFNTFKNIITFDSSIQMTQNFALVIENLSNSSLYIITNNWEAPGGGAGQGENLGVIFFPDIWNYSTSLFAIGGNTPLDLDFFIEPHVSYDIDVSFVSDQPCIIHDSTVNYSAMVSPLLTSRFFNYYAFESHFSGQPDSSITWDFGNGELGYGPTPNTSYSAGADSFSVTMYAQMREFRANTCVDSAQLSFPVLRTPLADFSSELDTANITVSFTNTSTGAETYLWDFGDGNFSTDPAPTHTYVTSGIYDVSLVATNANSCAGSITDTTFQTIGVATTGLDKDLIQDIRIFPNPTEGLLTLDLQLTQAYDISLSLFNQIGQQILEVNGEHLQRHQIQLDLEAQVAGIYFLSIDIAGQRIYRKISLR